MLTLGYITFDTDHPSRVADFWCAALGYTLSGEEEDWALIEDPGKSHLVLYFQRVPESKTCKNRVHPDLVTGDIPGEVERLRGLGASVVAQHDENGQQWTVMADPDGNEYCIVPPVEPLALAGTAKQWAARRPTGRT